ncbi:hypothetical protein Pla8534_37900 [Lignipirellula cremea]|uniref:AAA+ ATPase domain-containing protein n=2 Tax=Lignipirellula cremea TaxID=2528010 RepID=A0A518DVV8_9BACT|nr:hypothetical protein Pla8534_37900 [Lignipirellula cremea]
MPTHADSTPNLIAQGILRTQGDSPSETRLRSAAALRRAGCEPTPKAADGRPVAKTPFVPLAPRSLEEIGIPTAEIETLILRYLLFAGSSSGRRIADQIRLPFGLLRDLFQAMKTQMLVAYRGTAGASDYEYELSSSGVEKAHACNGRCTYFGSAPVALEDYIWGIEQQSVRQTRPKMRQIAEAFQDMVLSTAVLSQVGQAIHAGKGLFLYGAPGNGKTTIAERVIRGISEHLWIPRTITVTGEIIRLYDPSNHEEVPIQPDEKLASKEIDRRWIRIRRPTVVVGGELTMAHLEITHNQQTGINEAPMQLKSNGGALVVDDFGRQRVSTVELLNRWIVPLEKGYDFLTLPSGRQIQTPFDQILVFATNLEPSDLVDEAFLRRLPYKIEVVDPTIDQFRSLFESQAPRFELQFDSKVFDYLLEHHYRPFNRPLRYCHVRDLLTQVKNYCEFLECGYLLNVETIDVAARNYFAGLAC